MVDRREILQFIFNSHLSLFNTRRDHEWRVIISAMVLMGAVDATILSVKICLTVRQQDLWIFALILLFFRSPGTSGAYRCATVSTGSRWTGSCM